MATERDFELLDDYLTNRLKGDEKAAFEQMLQADPDLKAEMRLQQRLVNSIQKARIAELKSMLGAIPVPPAGPTGASVVTKFAIGTFVAGAVATGVYLYYSGKDETKPTDQVQQPIEQPVDHADNEVEVPETTQPDEQPLADDNQDPQNLTDRSEKKEITRSDIKHDAEEDKDEPVAEKRPLQVYDPSKEAEGDKPLENPNEPAVKQGSPSGPSMAVEIDRTNKKYTFHYQINGDRVILYGPFEKNLYEILEFFSEDGKRTAFLYYKEGYYQLKEDSTNKIKPLTPITDQNLISKLKEYRSN